MICGSVRQVLGWNALTRLLRIGNVDATATSVGSAMAVRGGAGRGIRSPWIGPEALSSMVLADIFGTEVLPVTRAEAMSLPAVAKARHLLVGQAAKLPLIAMRAGEQMPEQHTWLYSTSGAESPYQRCLWTVDDLIFYGWSLWIVERGADGQVSAAGRMPTEYWAFDEHGQVRVGTSILDPAIYILIQGGHEGVLAFAARTMRAARNLEETVAKRADSPMALVELHQTTGEQLNREEIRELLTDYHDARRDSRGAVMYTPSNVDVRVHGSDDGTLLVESRNAEAINLVRFMGVPAAMVDAAQSNSSLTYETLTGRNQEFLDYSLSMYLDPIAARLSMDDVVPRGQRVAFDVSEFTTLTPAATGNPTED